VDSHRPGGGDANAPLDGDARYGGATPTSEARAFGRYLIGDLVAAGAFTGVYRARDTQTGYHLTIKIATGLTGRPNARAEFLEHGARTQTFEPLSGLAVHDLGTVGDYAFIAYRTPVACSLADVLARGPMDPAAAFKVCESIASVLDAAHADGIVHGRIHPGNVLFESVDIFEGRVFVADFARPPSEPLGAHPFSAPEWRPGGSYDGRADVYSLACVLFECLTGTPPVGPRWVDGVFEAWRIGDPPVRLRELRSDANPALDRFLDRALAHDVARRPPHASAFVRDAWAAFQAEREVEAELVEPSEAPVPKRKVPALAIVTALVVLGAIGLGLLGARMFSADTPSAVTTTTAPPPAVEQLAASYLASLVPGDRCVTSIPERRLNGIAAVTCRPADAGVDEYELVAFGAEADLQSFIAERVQHAAGTQLSPGRATDAPACALEAMQVPTTTTPTPTTSEVPVTVAPLRPDYRYWAARDLNRGQFLCTPPDGGSVRLDYTGIDSLIGGYATRRDGDVQAVGAWWEQFMRPVLEHAQPFELPMLELPSSTTAGK